jgi:hypothetical protein
MKKPKSKGLIREPKDVDFTVESKPWTEQELVDFRKLMKELKAKKKPAIKTSGRSKLSATVNRKKKQVA